MIVIEPYRPSDAASAAALLDAVPEVPGTTEASFRAFTELSFNRGARDFRVVRLPRAAAPVDPRDPHDPHDPIVALLTSTLLEDSSPLIRHFRIVVHPEHRRRGIATQLMAEVEARPPEPLALLQCNSQRSWGPGNAFLERFGFAVAHRELLMRRSAALPSDPPVPPPPAGVTLRDATAADDATWSELHAVGYGDREDFFPLTAEDLHAERGRPGFTLVLAEHEGRAVGLGHGMHHEGDEGLVNSVIVRPEHRGRGLGAALMRATMQRLHHRGCAQVSLNVMASNEPAVALYRRLGFETYDEILTFRRALEEPTR